MIKRKFITIGTSLASLAFVSSVFGTPVLAIDSAGSTTTQVSSTRHATRLAKLAAQLQRNINRAVRDLTVRNSDLSKRLASQQAKGWNTGDAQSDITDLETQISTLKGIFVPTNPASIDDLSAPRQQLVDARREGWADVAKANKALFSTTTHKNKK